MEGGGVTEKVTMSRRQRDSNGVTEKIFVTTPMDVGVTLLGYSSVRNNITFLTTSGLLLFAFSLQPPASSSLPVKNKLALLNGN